MLKGYAEIELRDERTGEITRTGHGNMLTNGLSIALTPQIGRYTYPTGYLGGSGAPTTDEQKMNYNRSVMDHLLGGVFLFGETLQESAGNLELPTGALIGKGAHNAYSGVDAQRGSYNERESGVQPDGSYRHVWDFTTAQANGTIRALALTTHAGGIEGDGTREWNSSQTTENAPVYIEMNAGGGYGAFLRLPDGMAGHCFLFASYAKNRIYAVKNQYEITYNSSGSNPEIYYRNSGKIHIMEYGYPLSKISPFYDSYNLYRVQEHEIGVPEEFIAYAGTYTGTLRTCVSDSFLYLYTEGKSHGKGDTIKILRLDRDTLKADIVSFPNVTGNTYLSFSGGMNGSAGRLYLTDTHAYFMTSEAGEDNVTRSYVYRVSLADGTDAAKAEIKDRDGNSLSGNFVFVGSRGRHIVMALNAGGGSSSGYPLLLDPSTLETAYLNAGYLTTASSSSICHYEKLTAGLYLLVVTSYAGNFNFTPALDPCMLMTVNNLSAPVEKTAAQSMKVTYTITET